MSETNITFLRIHSQNHAKILTLIMYSSAISCKKIFISNEWAISCYPGIVRTLRTESLQIGPSLTVLAIFVCGVHLHYRVSVLSWTPLTIPKNSCLFPSLWFGLFSLWFSVMNSSYVLDYIQIMLTWLEINLGCCSQLKVWEKYGKDGVPDLMDAEVRPDLNAYTKVNDDKHRFYR